MLNFLTSDEKQNLLEGLLVARDNTGDQDWFDLLHKVWTLASNGEDLSADYTATVTCALREARDYVGDEEWSDQLWALAQKIEAL